MSLVRTKWTAVAVAALLLAIHWNSNGVLSLQSKTAQNDTKTVTFYECNKVFSKTRPSTIFNHAYILGHINGQKKHQYITVPISDYKKFQNFRQKQANHSWLDTYRLEIQKHSGYIFDYYKISNISTNFHQRFCAAK